MKKTILILSLLIYSLQLLSQKKEVHPVGEQKEPIVSFTEEVFSKFETAMDSISNQINSAAREMPSNITNVLIYKLKVKWMLKNELKVNETQFLASYFENKLKIALSRERRFLTFSGHDLKTLSVKATDSTLQVKNTYSELQLQEYAQSHNIHAIITPEVLITENKIIVFLQLNDLHAVTIWNKSFEANTYASMVPTMEDELRTEYSLRKFTGLPIGTFTISFLSSKVYSGGNLVDDNSYSFIGLGYRFTEVATIIDPVDFFVDSKLLYTPRFGGAGLIITPGFGFELLSSERVGRRLVMLNISAGYYLQSNLFTGAYSVSLSLQLSKNIGTAFDVYYLSDPGKVGNFYPAKLIIGGQMFIVL